MNNPSINNKVVLGVVGGVGVLAAVFYWGFWAPRAVLQKQIAGKLNKVNELDRKLRKERDMKKTWTALAARTFSEEDVGNQFDALIKRLAEEHGLEILTTRPTVHRNTSGKFGVKRVSYKIPSAEGTLNQAIGFLYDFYRLPVLAKITDLRIEPTDVVGGGRHVKMNLSIESLVFPQNDPKMKVATMPAGAIDKLEPLRAPALAREEYNNIWRRNVFAAFEPPPPVAIEVRNDDINAVKVTLQPTWENKPGEAKTFSVGDKGTLTSPIVYGNKVTVTAEYEDKKKPKFTQTFEVDDRFVSNTKRFKMQVPLRSDPDPATDIEVTVRNKDEGPVEVSPKVTQVGGRVINLAALTVKKNESLKLEKWENVTQIELTAKYDDGQTHSARFTPTSPRPMQYDVPPKPIEGTPRVVEVAQAADPNLIMSGYASGSEMQEMFATDPVKKERKIFKLGDKVDGGELMYVHNLGAIVKMTGGQFYIYPVGRKFVERELLEEARKIEDLPAAIDAWIEKSVDGLMLVERDGAKK